MKLFINIIVIFLFFSCRDKPKKNKGNKDIYRITEFTEDEKEKLDNIENEVKSLIDKENKNNPQRATKAKNAFIELKNKVKQNLKEIDSKDSCDGRTLLMYSIIIGNLEIVKLLLKKNANINIRDKNKFKAIHFAIFNGKKDIFDLLLSKITNIDEIDKEKNITLLMYSSAFGKLDMVKTLFLKKADINKQNPKTGKSVLHYGVQRSNKQVVTFLIKNGAKVNSYDNNNNTPLDFAIKKNNTEIIQFLKTNGAKTGEELGLV